MENIKVSFDTDVLLNWLCKEEDPNTGEKLWKAPYEILKMVEEGNLLGFTKRISSCIVSRDKTFIEIVNEAETEKIAYTPEELLEAKRSENNNKDRNQQ